MQPIESREYPQVTLSTSLMLDTGGMQGFPHEKRLILVKQAVEGKWGIIAGKYEYLPSQGLKETLWQSSLRELQEETDIAPNELILASLLGNLYVPRINRLSMGFIYRAAIKGDFDRFDQTYKPTNSHEIEAVKGFTIDEVLKLVSDENMIYRPEFNLGLLKFWAFDRISDKYWPWEGREFADSVAESWTGFDKSVREIFDNQILVPR